jgi:hypothetical protein
MTGQFYAAELLVTAAPPLKYKKYFMHYFTLIITGGDWGEGIILYSYK